MNRRQILKKTGLFLSAAVLFFFIGYFAPHGNFGSYNNDFSPRQSYSVVKVIDGDTIQVERGGERELVRLLGINTPEVESSYRRQECFGPEASGETKRLLEGRKVYLLPDPNASDRDKYNRLLRYVFLPNGEFVNAELVKNGYAFSYILEPIQFQDFFDNLEEKAQKNKLGLWGECRK